MIKKLFSALFVVISFISFISFADTYWVDQNNTSPPYLGTREDPFPHPAYACYSPYHRLTPGDTINVLPGTYIIDPDDRLSKINITASESNRESPPIVFQGIDFEGIERVHIQAAPYESVNCFCIDNSAYNVIIQNFYISDAFQRGREERHPSGVKSHGSGTIVRDNHIYGCSIGVFLTQEDNHAFAFGSQVYGNVISNCGEAGIRVKGTFRDKVFSNLLYNNGVRDEPAGSITIYRTQYTEVYNNTIITSDVPCIEMYRGTDPYSQPCRFCKIFDNVCIKTQESDVPIFIVHYTMRDIRSNYYYSNTWYTINGECRFQFGGWGHSGTQSFSSYLNRLPQNEMNGRGETVRNPELNDNYLLLPNSPELNVGSRLSTDARLNETTACITQQYDLERVDRGYHQKPFKHELNPNWQLPPTNFMGMENENDGTAISFIPKEFQIQRASLFNILGQKVAVLKNRTVSDLRQEANNLDLAAGLYIVMMQTDQGIHSFKTMIH